MLFPNGWRQGKYIQKIHREHKTSGKRKRLNSFYLHIPFTELFLVKYVARRCLTRMTQFGKFFRHKTYPEHQKIMAQKTGV